jgi:hypothetical protein
MTRVYTSPGKASGLRVLAVGAGAYPYAGGGEDEDSAPALADLTSVGPSVMTFLRRLLTDWRADLAIDLLSIDLLLSDPAQPDGAAWPGFAVDGEAPAGHPVDPPTLANLQVAMTDALQGATGDDGLLFLFCGHGFSAGGRYFVLSDFGQVADHWSHCVDLDGLELALRAKPPRTQWLFWDCCADIPQEALEELGKIGSSILPAKASRISAAARRYGQLSRFGIASSPIGAQAFGIRNKPSRFTEMLMEGIEGAGAIKREAGQWWVDDRGLIDAVRSYARRHPALPNPQFYRFVTPFSSDAPERIRFRRLAQAPTSMLVAAAKPRPAAFRHAKVKIVRDGAANEKIFDDYPGPSAVIHLQVEALQHYKVSASFAGAPLQERDCFADLPLAEEVEFDSP